MTLSSNQPPGGGCSCLTTPGSYPTTSVIRAPSCKCSRPPAGGLGRQLSVEDSGREPGVPTGDGEPWVGGGGELRPGLMGSRASPAHSLPASPLPCFQHASHPLPLISACGSSEVGSPTQSREHLSLCCGFVRATYSVCIHVCICVCEACSCGHICVCVITSINTPYMFTNVTP